MRAEVLIAGMWRRPGASSSLYTYRVPASLADRVTPGQLVAVPFGERTAAGIVWELDASDDLSEENTEHPTRHPCSDAADGATAEDPGPQISGVRAISGLLLAEPVLFPTQRALAEWLATYYAAPLASAVRPMLPPGLVRSVRHVLRLAPQSAQAGEAGLAPTTAAGPREAVSIAGPGAHADQALPRDEAIVLAMLHERGELEREGVVQALGAARASAAIRSLLAAARITQSATLPRAQTTMRRERTVRLTGTPQALATWREEARRHLDALPRPAARPRGIAARARRDTGEQAAERLLRQLAVLDVLARHTTAGGEPPEAWRVEELRRLTRATSAALTELETAGLLTIEEAEARHDPLQGRALARTEPLPLSAAQSRALRMILGENAHPEAGEHPGYHQHEPAGRVFLLHGITGSGKTEVYLQALAATLAAGRRGIVLVPEIALTPQAVARFAGRFPGRVALLHSGLADAERLDEWRRIRTGAADIVVGSRSALFAPVERLGLIVVDEEHEAAYKEEERVPTYLARDVAVRLGALTGARVVLGSATPSVETYWRATHGDYTLVELSERAPVAVAARSLSHSAPTMPSSPPSGASAILPQSAQADFVAAGPPGAVSTAGLLVDPPAPSAPGLPPVTIVDLRAELRAGNTSILSEALHTALAETLARGEQAILFLNRRGTASSVMCRECGYVARCPRCDVSLTFHADERALLCHYCGRREPTPETCPVCWSASIRYFGIGTERVEAAVKRQFPGARVLRWDRDTARTRQVHEELLRAFAERRADVLVGTQMIAKGLDLPGVTLVGAVSADIALFLPDFRAAERAFQLLTQVAGRAGRGEQPGRVLIQTFNPEHFCIQAAAHHDYATFVTAELAARERYRYPPFRRFVKCTFSHADRHTAQVEATVLADRVERLIAALPLPGADLVGPAPALLERLRGRYRWQLIVRAPDPLPLLAALDPADLPPGWSVDLDPTHTA